MKKYFSINGYWKDNQREFEGYIVTNYDDYEGIDDQIFFYGLDETDLQEAIRLKENTVHEFVITSYEEL